MLARVVLEVEIDLHVSTLVGQPGGRVQFPETAELAIHQLLGFDQGVIVSRLGGKVGKSQGVVRLVVVLVQHVLAAFDGLLLALDHLGHLSLQVVEASLDLGDEVILKKRARVRQTNMKGFLYS